MNHHMRDSSEAARTIRAPSATCQGDRERSVVVSRPAQMVSGHAQLAGENWASRRMCGIYGMVGADAEARSEEHTSELQSRSDIVCRLLLEKKNDNKKC